MIVENPRDLLAADEPLDALPPGFGPRVRRAADVRRRRRRALVAGGAAVVLAGAVVVAVPWAAGGEQTLTPAPTVAAPGDDTTGEGEVVPAHEVPPCVNPEGYGRIAGTPGQVRGTEPVQDSVQEDVSGRPGYLPEVEQALVDTAPPAARIDCASKGTVVLLVGDDGTYVEIRTGLSNPLHPQDEYFTRDDVETYTTPLGARVRLDASLPEFAHVELWAGRYDVTLSVRESSPRSAGLPLSDTRAWVERLGDRLIEESHRRGEVPVELLDRTPNPPPQAVVDQLLASAPDGAALLGPDRGSAAQTVRVAVAHPDGRTAALGSAVSTTNPRQASPLRLDGLSTMLGEHRVEDERDGWPPGLLVVVVDRHGQLLIQHRDDVFLTFITHDPSVVTPEQIRRWASDVVAALE